MCKELLHEHLFYKKAVKMVRWLVFCVAFLLFMKQGLMAYPILKEYNLKPIEGLEMQSVYMTNIEPRGAVTSKIFNFPVVSKIYDVRLIVYSHWFADMYGYSNDYVVDKPAGFTIGTTVFVVKNDVFCLVLGEVNNNRNESILRVIFNRDRCKGSVVV